MLENPFDMVLISNPGPWSRSPPPRSCAVITRYIFHDIAYGTAMPVAERKSDFKLTIDTPYLALTGELWGVCCKDIGENWPRYIGTVMY